MYTHFPRACGLLAVNPFMRHTTYLVQSIGKFSPPLEVKAALMLWSLVDTRHTQCSVHNNYEGYQYVRSLTCVECGALHILTIYIYIYIYLVYRMHDS